MERRHRSDTYRGTSATNFEDSKTESESKNETEGDTILTTNGEEKPVNPKRKMSNEFLRQRTKKRMVMFQNLFPNTRNYEEERKKIRLMLDKENQEKVGEIPKIKSTYRLNLLCKHLK